ncbi:hypothetical protein [Peribacillus huizhouensis]|uniref:Uncharacterized protein n=1 Tax=Peribacillus huizhouensis TaxID=1501239 RepID=A0ABR6CS33_9BACI|nr:hypothetical protein [Peribacillus huizhouensis]MBA9027546.1 hypothetical protein [Peribacillus huizhouensis]
MSEVKTHLITDESIGGVLREYVEVDRKAKVGDYVIDKNDVRKVLRQSEIGVTLGDAYYGLRHGCYRTLESTEIVQIIGTRYRLVDRKAEIGEKVIIVET